MWYAIIAEDHDNSLERRMAARPAHLERIEGLKRQGRVLVAGPFPAVDAEDPAAAGFTGSLMVNPGTGFCVREKPLLPAIQRLGSSSA